MSASARSTATPSSPPAGGGGRRSILAVLTGNPNCGKTTLFNALTGLRAKVGNYAGVTVERKEGRLQGAPVDRPVALLDLPGTYSLSPQSLDEQIARDVLLHRLEEVAEPDLIIVVVDASNLERNLYYATQVIELGHPVFIALNMMDVAKENGHVVDAERLASALGTPVFPMVASTHEGIPALRDALIKFESALEAEARSRSRSFCELPPRFEHELAALTDRLRLVRPGSARAEALLLLGDPKTPSVSNQPYPPDIAEAVMAARQRLDQAGVDWRSAPIEARYARVAAIQAGVVTESEAFAETFSDKLDRVLTHKLWGVVIFVAIMTFMFESIFSFAKVPMNALQASVSWLGALVGSVLPPGDLHSLLVEGVIAGVGAVVVFLPQICLLFIFIGLLEDTGYMARAAFLMDRLMSKVGLHGKSFIPMLSSFACAIPGIMATRTIESPKDRLVTILVAPLMSCSARLPVYTLLIGACIPERRVLGLFQLSGLTMLAMYLLGIVMALLMAWLFKRTLLKGVTPMLIMELPPYKRPVARVILRHAWDRSKLFLRRAGTVILGINILLWFLATYPRDAALGKKFISLRKPLVAQVFPSVTDPAALAQKAVELRRYRLLEANAVTNLAPGFRAAAPATAEAHKTPATTVAWSPAQVAAYQKVLELDNEEAGERLRRSFAGRLGHLIEPVLAPLGFDWKMGIGIVSSFAAREVFVSTMSIVYNIGKSEDTGESTELQSALREQVHDDGTPVYSTLMAVTLMVFYVLALQCVSTVAIVRRETNTWKWPLVQWAYMGALAWVLAFITYHGGRMLGWQ